MQKAFIYKLSSPQEQVGLPTTMKWAVARVGDDGLPIFVDAFRTKRRATQAAKDKGFMLVPDWTG